METVFALHVVDDDSLHGRAVAEGMGLEDKADLLYWLAEQARESGRWPQCGCASRSSCCLDHPTGLPRAPERRRLETEARALGHRHTWAQAWL